MKTADWENPERSLGFNQETNPMTSYVIRLERSLSNFTGQFLGLFQSLLMGTKFRLVHKSVMNRFMTVIIDFRLFSKKILVFFQMLIPFKYL